MVRQSRRRRRAHPSVSSGRDYFNACWLAEWLRLREAHWGPMEDAAEVRRARIEGQTFTQRILLRARFLCRRENLDAIQEHWMHRSEEHTSELQSLMRISYAVFCLKKKTHTNHEEIIKLN